jgi:hypothetical protein
LIRWALHFCAETRALWDNNPSWGDRSKPLRTNATGPRAEREQALTAALDHVEAGGGDQAQLDKVDGNVLRAGDVTAYSLAHRLAHRLGNAREIEAVRLRTWPPTLQRPKKTVSSEQFLTDICVVEMRNAGFAASKKQARVVLDGVTKFLTLGNATPKDAFNEACTILDACGILGNSHFSHVKRLVDAHVAGILRGGSGTSQAAVTPDEQWQMAMNLASMTDLTGEDPVVTPLDMLACAVEAIGIDLRLASDFLTQWASDEHQRQPVLSHRTIGRAMRDPASNARSIHKNPRSTSNAPLAPGEFPEPPLSDSGPTAQTRTVLKKRRAAKVKGLTAAKG